MMETKTIPSWPFQPHAQSRPFRYHPPMLGYGKVSKKNPVSEYGNVMGALKNKYKGGLGR